MTDSEFEVSVVQVGQDCAAHFVNSLSSDEKALFQAASVAEALLREVEDANSQHKATSVSRKASAAVLPFIAGIEQYGRALDVFANSNDMLCPLWGSIRIVLHLAKEFGKYFDRIASMLEDIGIILHQLPRSLRLYPNNKNLQASVVAIYKDLFEFASRAKNVFKVGKTKPHGLKSMKNIVGLAASLRLIWKPFDVQFGDIKERLSKNVGRIETEADLAEKEIANQERSKDDVRWGKVEVSQRILAEFIDEQNVAKVNEWLSPINVATNHKAASNLRHGKTGTWFLQSHAFQNWIRTDSSFLWLYAIPGAGKTVLASSIINHLRDNVQSKTTALAYFYCDYKDIQKQDPAKVLSTILASLAKQNSHVFEAVQKFFLEQQKDSTTYTAEFDELLNHFADFVHGSFRTVVIVVDALDEAGPSNMECLAHAFKFLHQHCRQFKILITSRNELSISRSFENLPRVSIEQSDVASDIKDFITADLSAKISQKKLRVRDPELERLIRDRLVDGSEGMFQWAKCQIEALCRSRNNKAIKAALLNLPTTLQDTYFRILQRVEDQYPEDIATVSKILRWLVKGIRNLTLEELAEAIAIDPESDETVMDFDAVDNDPEDILEVLGGLVTVASDRTISLAHFSVKEFLVSDAIKATKPRFWVADDDVEAQLASVCLTYLCYDDFDCCKLPDVEAMEQRLEKYKLFRYATQAWAVHAHRSEKDDDQPDHVADRTMRLLSSRHIETGNFHSWVECYQYCKFSRQNRRQAVEPIFVAAYFGLTKAAYTLLTTADLTPQLIAESFMAAAANGHATVIKAFLDHFKVTTKRAEEPNGLIKEDGSFNETDEGSTMNGHGEDEGEGERESSATRLEKELPKALYIAAAKGHIAVVSLLLSRGTPIDARGGQDGTALQAAALEGRPDVVKLLLEEGANYWQACKRYGTPLSAAAEKAHERTFGVLLDHGANPNGGGGWYSLPLVSAIVGKNMNIIQRLIDAGADVNAVGGRHGGPLSAAAAFGMNGLITELVDYGAKVNDDDDKASDALYAASLAGHAATVDVLLDLGADVNAKGGRHRNALGVASSEGHLQVVNILIDAGADTEYFDEHWGNAIQIAAQRGHVAVVTMLAEAGMDPNAEAGDKGTALVGASANGHTEVIKTLFDLGVSSGNTAEMTSALVAASFSGHIDTIQLLFDNGADVSGLNEYSQTVNYCTPLQAAASRGDIDTVSRLIDLGARVDDADEGWFGTALVAATNANENRKEVVTMILAAGADVNEISSSSCHFHGSPLIFTIRAKDLECTTILLDHGADVNLQWADFYSPLEEAISASDDGMVDCLLDRGAEINNVSEPMDLRGQIGDGLRWGTITALQTAAWYNHGHLVHRFIELGAELSVVNDDAPFKSALQAAAYRGYVHIVQALIEHGGDVNERGGYFGSPLQAATCRGHLEIAQLLIDAGAAANEIDIGYFHSALLSVCTIGHTSILKLLLDNGADVNQKQKGAYPYPVHAACKFLLLLKNGPDFPPDPLRLLLEAGADPNVQGGRFGTALQAAAADGDLTVCNRLIEAGADPNVTGGFYNTPLQAAYRNGYFLVIDKLYNSGARHDLTGGSRAGSVFGQGLGWLPGMMHDEGWLSGCCQTLITQLLFEHQFDPNLRYGAWGNPLQNAVVARRRIDEVKMIVNAGGDIDKVGGKYGTAITASIRLAYGEVRDELLEMGADVNLGNDRYPNAAFGAIRANDTKTLKVLIEKGIEMNVFSIKFGTLAQCAAEVAPVSTLKRLLRAGAEINTPPCGVYGSPLQAAAWAGNEDMVRYLIRQGADVKGSGGRFGGVLNAAIFHCSDNLIEHLLKKGADVNEPGRAYGTPLQAAASTHRFNTVLILLRYGADINRTGGKYATALQAACAGGRYTTIQLLVENGADANIVGGRYRTALNAAAIRGEEQTVRYLLESAGATWSLVDRKSLRHVKTALLDEADNVLHRALQTEQTEEEKKNDPGEEDTNDTAEVEEQEDGGGRGGGHNKNEDTVGDAEEDERGHLPWNVESIPNACNPYEPRRSKWSIIRNMSFLTLSQKYAQGVVAHGFEQPINDSSENLTRVNTASSMTLRNRRGLASRVSTFKADADKPVETWDNSALNWVNVEVDED